MRICLLVVTMWIVYTAWCCAYGPPYNDAYGRIVHAAYCMTADNPLARCP